MLYTHNHNTDLRTSINERTHFFTKIYLSHFILERVDISMACEKWVERHMLRERTSSNIFFQAPVGANVCTPLQARQRRVDRLRLPRSTASLPLSKSDRVVLIIWSPSGYTPVVPECPDHACHNVTACQSTRGYQERTENPCHMLYNRQWFRYIGISLWIVEKCNSFIFILT